MAGSQEFSETACDILREFEDEDIRNTTHLTSATNRPNDVVGYHIKQHLIQHGLVEHIGVDETSDLNNPPNEYRITDCGRTALKELDPKREQIGGRVGDEIIEDLWEELDDQEDTDDWLEGRIDELETQVEEQQAFIDSLKSRMGGS